MDSDYRPQSPDLASYAAPESPDLSGLGSPRFGNFQAQHNRFPSAFGGTTGHTGVYQPTSLPQQALYPQHAQMPPRQVKSEHDDEWMPDAPPSRRGRRVKEEVMSAVDTMPPAFAAGPMLVKSEDSDPTLGCKLNTSFPVARIKRIMQADEDIGKVAQVTPTVVSRALELFMIKLISAAAQQARGPVGSGQAATSKGPRRILAQHLKRAVVADDKFDFLNEIANKVPDAPAKNKKEGGGGSESEEAKPKKKGKRRKDSRDDF